MGSYGAIGCRTAKLEQSNFNLDAVNFYFYRSQQHPSELQWQGTTEGEIGPSTSFQLLQPSSFTLILASTSVLIGN